MGGEEALHARVEIAFPVLSRLSPSTALLFPQYFYVLLFLFFSYFLSDSSYSPRFPVYSFLSDMVLDQNLFFVIFFLVKGVFPVFNVILFSLPFFSWSLMLLLFFLVCMLGCTCLDLGYVSERELFKNQGRKVVAGLWRDVEWDGLEEKGFLVFLSLISMAGFSPSTWRKRFQSSYSINIP